MRGGRRPETRGRGRGSGLALALILGALLVLPAAAAATTRIWVSPRGDNADPGTKAAPLRTLAAAQRAARRGVRAQPSSDVVVLLRGGTYRLKEPLRMSGRDSGRRGHTVAYRAYDGERPLVSGAFRVPGSAWKLYDAAANIWRARVGIATRELYVNGKRATRARTSDYPAGFRPAWNEGGPRSGIEYLPTLAPGGLNPAGWGDPTTWTNPEDVEAVIDTQWKTMTVPLASVTPAQGSTPGLLRMAEPAWHNANIFRGADGQPGLWSFWQVTRFENALQFLDEPGEWYLDEVHGWLYYMPNPWENLLGRRRGAGRRNAGRRAGHRGEAGPQPRIPRPHLRLRDLAGTERQRRLRRRPGRLPPGRRRPRTEHDRPRPQRRSDARQRRLPLRPQRPLRRRPLPPPRRRRAGARHRLPAHPGQGQHLQRRRLLGDPTERDPRRRPQPASQAQTSLGNRIAGNLVAEVGWEYPDAPGIFVGFSSGTEVVHNRIEDVPWSGIAIGWGWGLLDPGGFPGLPHASRHQWGQWETPTPMRNGLVAGNTITDFLGLLWDGGAIYTTGFQGTSFEDGLRIEGNTAYGKRPQPAATPSTPTAAAASSPCAKTSPTKTRSASPTSARRRAPATRFPTRSSRARPTASPTAPTSAAASPTATSRISAIPGCSRR